MEAHPPMTSEEESIGDSETRRNGVKTQGWGCEERIAKAEGNCSKVLGQGRLCVSRGRQSLRVLENDGLSAGAEGVQTVTAAL